MDLDEGIYRVNSVNREILYIIRWGKSWTQVGQRIFPPPVSPNGFFRYDIQYLGVNPGTEVDVVFRLTGNAIDAPSPRRQETGSYINIHNYTDYGRPVDILLE